MADAAEGRCFRDLIGCYGKAAKGNDKSYEKSCYGRAVSFETLSGLDTKFMEKVNDKPVKITGRLFDS